MRPQQFQAFTVTANGRLRDLVTDCHACAAFDPATVPQNQRPNLEKFKAIWDTGATHSAISQDVVNACGLKPIGMKDLYTAAGLTKRVPTFFVNFRLPNAVGAVNIEVSLADLRGAQILIGMDIITAGDFAITNVGQKTVFTFRFPSVATIDFVKKAKAQRQQRGFKPGPPRKGRGGGRRGGKKG